MPRNAAGLYTLPLPQVEPNTVIESEWANDTLADIEATLSDSLSRSGMGGMAAAFMLINGTALAPSLSFLAEPSSGLFRQSSGVVGMSIQGVAKQTWNANGTTVIGTSTLQGDVSITGVLTAAGVVGPLTLTSLSVVGDLTVGGTTTLNGDTLTVGKLTTAASTATQAGLNLPHGVAPTTPANGDLWTTTTQLVARINGATRAMAMLSVAQTFSAAQTFSSTVAFNGGTTIGDAAGDALTINSNTASIPNHLNFTGGSIGVGMAPVNTTTAVTIDMNHATQSWLNLYVAGTRKAFFSATGNSTALGTHDAFPLYFLTGNVGRAIIAADGNVVIGTGGTTTNYGAGFLAVGINASTSPVFDLKVGDVRTATYSAAVTGATLGTITNTGLVFITNGTEKARITPEGNVGVNTATPSNYGAGFRAISVNATTGAAFEGFIGGTKVGSLFIGPTQTVLGTDTGSATPLLFITSGSEKMRIAADGNVGIGMTPVNFGAGVTNLAIGSTLNSLVDLTTGGVRKASFSAQATQTVIGTIANEPFALWSNSLARMILAADGSIGMGYSPTTDAGRVLTTNSQAAVSTAILLRCVGTIAGSISHPTGTTTAFNTSSDARLKRNIRPAKDVGKIIDNIPVVSFDWKTDGIHVPVGMIAQDVHGVFPQAVYEGSDVDTDPWQLDHSKMVPLLLKEIQSLRERVNVLEHECH